LSLDKGLPLPWEDTWFFVAPSKFTGDFSGSYGLSLSFDLKRTWAAEFVGDDQVQVDILNNESYISYDFQSSDMIASADWTTYPVTLDEGSAWFVNGTTKASEADIRSVLKNITDIKILGAQFYGVRGYLDNVVLECGR
jgi:hypothetical protein